MKSVVTQALQRLGLPEASSTVFADSACSGDNLLPNTLSTTLMAYRSSGAPVKGMVGLLLRAHRVIHLKCNNSEYDLDFEALRCRLLFTLCATPASAACSNSTSIFVTATGLIKTHEFLESELLNVPSLPWKLREGIHLSNPWSRCAKLTDITKVTLKGFGTVSSSTRRYDFLVKWRDRREMYAEAVDEDRELPLLNSVLAHGIRGNSSSRNVLSTNIYVKLSTWSEKDSLLSMDSAMVKCIMPVRALDHRASLFLDVFSGEVWIAILSSITLVCVLATFPDSKEALDLFGSLSLSTLTSHGFRIPRQSPSHFILLGIFYSTLQIVLVNVYKNEITSAFSQVYSNEEIRKLISAAKRPPGEGDSQIMGRPYSSDREHELRVNLGKSLYETKAFCGRDLMPLLNLFPFPVATYKRRVMYSSLCAGCLCTPFRNAESIRTLQKYGLISYKSIYLSKEDVTPRLLRLHRRLSKISPEKGYPSSWEVLKRLLKVKYDATFMVEEGTVLKFDEMLKLFQAFAMILSGCCCSVLIERAARGNLCKASVDIHSLKKQWVNSGLIFLRSSRLHLLSQPQGSSSQIEQIASLD